MDLTAKKWDETIELSARKLHTSADTAKKEQFYIRAFLF